MNTLISASMTRTPNRRRALIDPPFRYASPIAVVISTTNVGDWSTARYAARFLGPGRDAHGFPTQGRRGALSNRLRALVDRHRSGSRLVATTCAALTDKSADDV